MIDWKGIINVDRIRRNSTLEPRNRNRENP